MKARKTLLFMLWNPTSFIVYFLACWILISATFTIWDEPFRYGTWPDAAEAAEGAFVKGTAKDGEVWTKWYQRQTEAKAQNYTLAEMPPSLKASLLTADD